MVQGAEEIHAAEQKDDEGRCRKGHVHAEQDLSHVVEPGQDPLPRRPCRFGIVHVDRRLARFRQQGDKDDDDAQAAEPVGQAAPEKEALGQDLQVGNDCRPGPGKAGNALEQAVEIVQVAAEAIGQHPQKSCQEPAQAGDSNAFAHGQFLRPHVAIAQESPARQSTDGHGAHKSRPAVFGESQGHEQWQAHDAGLGPSNPS